MRDPLGDGGGPDPIDETEPASEEPATDPAGQGSPALTLPASGRMVPTLYGTRKIPALLIEKSAPARLALGSIMRRAASTYYNQGEYVVILTYCKTGAVSGLDCIWLCTASGTTGTDPDFNGSTLYSIGDTITTDGSADWKMVAVWGQTDPEKWLPIVQSMIAALCEGEAQGSLQMWWDKERVNAASLTNPTHGLTIQLGTDALTNGIPAGFSGSAFDYQHTAIVYGTSIPTGNAEELPALAFEMQGVMLGSSERDVNPADIINDLITHSRRGCEISSSRVDSSITGTAAGGYRVYCDAFGLRLSMYIDAQKSALSHIADVLAATNSSAIWSQGKIKITPLGDVASVGQVYGSTAYVPANTSVAALGVDDFLDTDQPVQVRHRGDGETYNAFPIEYIDGEGGSYPKLVQEDVDQSDVDRRGLVRAPTLALPFSFPTAARVQMLSRILAQRSLNVRNTYRFRLSWRHLYLEPNDIVTLTEPELGLSATPVRLTRVTENEDGTFSCEAEDYPAAAQGALTYTPQAGDGYESNDRSTVPPAAVDGSTLGMGVAVVTASSVAERNIVTTSLSNINTNNLFPNPSSEVEAPAGADVGLPVYDGLALASGSAEWYGRIFLALTWQASTAYAVGDTVVGLGGNGYRCITAGTSAGSGGPTGTGDDITDGTAHWEFVTADASDYSNAYAGSWARQVVGAVEVQWRIPCLVGETHSFWGQVRKISGTGDGFLSIDYLDAAGNHIGGAITLDSSNSTSWTRVSPFPALAAPSTAVAVEFAFGVTGGTGTYWFDALFACVSVDPQAITPGSSDLQVLQTKDGGLGGGVAQWVTHLDQEPWLDVVSNGGYSNSWVDYGGAYFNVAFFKDTLGVVHTRGMMKSGTINAQAFVLPSGYRPSATVRFVVESNGAHGVVTITSAGVVTPAVGNNAWVSFDGISFKAD